MRNATAAPPLLPCVKPRLSACDAQWVTKLRAPRATHTAIDVHLGFKNDPSPRPSTFTVTFALELELEPVAPPPLPPALPPCAAAPPADAAPSADEELVEAAWLSA
jgi:hypothetical protein